MKAAEELKIASSCLLSIGPPAERFARAYFLAVIERPRWSVISHSTTMSCKGQSCKGHCLVGTFMPSEYVCILKDCSREGQ